jgi:23S rRNA (pseudouridine1915-N3)-methyltransferase
VAGKQCAAQGLRLVAVGRLKTSAEAELYERYASRIRPKLSLTEIAEGLGAPTEIKRREAEAILAALNAGSFAVTLDQDGAKLDSGGFAKQLDTWLATGKTPVFIIGGAEGLDRRVLDRANAALSLGAFTWPHTLARVMLVEQIFRARCISQGHPYHRCGRP